MKKSSMGNKLVMIVILIYLVFPLILTFIYSVFTEWMDVLPVGFTLRYYVELFSDKIFWMALLRTVIISFVPVFLTAIMVLLAMYVVVVYLPSLDKYIQILCTIPYAVQGVILPVSVLSLYAGAPPPLSNHILMLVFTYCIVILPYMYQGIKNSLNSVDAKRLLEADQMLGADRFYAFFKVVVPALINGVIISSMLSVAIVFGDFVIVNTIGGNYYFTAQMYLLRKMFISGQMTSAVIMVLFAISLVIFATVYYLKAKNQERENA